MNSENVCLVKSTKVDEELEMNSIPCPPPRAHRSSKSNSKNEPNSGLEKKKSLNNEKGKPDLRAGSTPSSSSSTPVKEEIANGENALSLHKSPPASSLSFKINFQVSKEGRGFSSSYDNKAYDNGVEEEKLFHQTLISNASETSKVKREAKRVECKSFTSTKLDINCNSDSNVCNTSRSKLTTSFSQLPKTVKSVKRIGVFYSDLCDVIKGMRSSSTSNQTDPNVTTSSHSNDVNTTLVNSDQTTISRDANPFQTDINNINNHERIETDPSTTTPISVSHNLNTNLTNITEPLPSTDLPDILNSHLPPPPPYSTLPPPTSVSLQSSSLSPLPPDRLSLTSRRLLSSILSTNSSSNNSQATTLTSFANNNYITSPTLPPPHSQYHHHNHRHHRYLRSGCSRESDVETNASKSCLTCTGLSIRWFILLISFIGLVCAVIGTFLGAARPTGKEHLTLALLMIGVGIVLITVSGIAWRLTSTGPTWRNILGFSDLSSASIINNNGLETTSRRFLPRVTAPHGRSGSHHHPYGAMFYPEFHYRPPPPSYQASMQEYRLRLLLLERSSSHPPPTSLSPVSPPPTYQSSAASSITGTLNRTSNCPNLHRPTSRPPSYRSVIDQSQSVLRASSRINSNLTSSNASQAHLLSSQTTSSTYKDDINRVTIHQTNTTSQVCTQNGVNIVAISSAPEQVISNCPPPAASEVQILAHV